MAGLRPFQSGGLVADQIAGAPKHVISPSLGLKGRFLPFVSFRENDMKTA
jgi:hypothetical protein